VFLNTRSPRKSHQAHEVACNHYHFVNEVQAWIKRLENRVVLHFLGWFYIKFQQNIYLFVDLQKFNMAKISLKALSLKMKALDICMLTTQTTRGHLSSRPMSNNGDVEYDGNSYFFTFEQSRTAKDIREFPQVTLSFNGADDLYISLTGKARLLTRKSLMEEHWLDELKQWFPKGLDTPGIVLIHVKASRVKFWEGKKNGEVRL
jgi:general stress protein 26